VAGYAKGEFKAHSLAASYLKSEEFEVTTPLQPAMASRDWAVIELAEPIDLKPIGPACERRWHGIVRDRQSWLSRGSRPLADGPAGLLGQAYLYARRPSASYV
jgi:hypothetical protein